MKFLIFLFSLFSLTTVKADPESLERILQDFKEYRPSSYWITHDFYKLDADEFYTAFGEMIALFTNKNRLSLYFDLNPSERIDPYFFRDKILWQCKNYQYFITHTVVDVETKKLRKIFAGNKPGATEIPLEDYGTNLYPDEWVDIQLFYCCYLDALSHYIHEIISYEESHKKLAELAPVVALFKEYTLNLTEPKKVKKYRTALNNFLQIERNYAVKILKQILEH